MVIGDILEKMGIGILGDTADGEMSNVSIAYCETGLDLLQGALQVNTLHIRECAANGLQANAANHSVFHGVYLEKNGGWGAYLDRCTNVTMTGRIWADGGYGRVYWRGVSLCARWGSFVRQPPGRVSRRQHWHRNEGRAPSGRTATIFIRASSRPRQGLGDRRFAPRESTSTRLLTVRSFTWKALLAPSMG